QRIGRGVAGEHDAGRPLTLVPRGLCIRAPAGGQCATGQGDGGRRCDDLGESLYVTPRLVRKVRLTLNTLAAPGQVLSMAYLTWRAWSAPQPSVSGWLSGSPGVWGDRMRRAGGRRTIDGMSTEREYDQDTDGHYDENTLDGS